MRRALVLATAALAGCSLLVGVDGLTGGAPDAGVDAAIESGALPGDAAPDVTGPPDAGDAGDAGDAARDGAADAPTCTPTARKCSGACADLMSDPDHCGSCSNACASGTSCVAGTCVKALYLSPSGDDTTGDGTEQAPWKTFGKALGSGLFVGGTGLVLLDGDYSATTTGLPRFDCKSTGNAPNGGMGRPVAIAAKNERKARLLAAGRGNALSLLNCDHYRVSGLDVSSADVVVDAGTTAEIVSMSAVTDVALSRMLVHGTNRYLTGKGVYVNNSSDVVLEESELYAFDVGLEVESSTNVRIRRSYASAATYADIDGGASTGDPRRGEYGFYLSGSDVIVENCIDDGDSVGFTFAGGTPRLFGSASLANQVAVNHGVLVANDVVMLAQPPSVAQTYGFASYNSTATAVLSGITGVGPFTGLFAWYTNTPNSGTLLVHDALGEEVLTAFIVQVNNFYADHVNMSSPSAYSNVSVSDGGSGHVQYASTGDAKGIGTGPGRCLVYVPKGSNMEHAGADGGDIGANIVYRYEDGVLTNEKLWGTSGSFPCGAVVPGVNDKPDASCADVNLRLRVGIPDCPAP